MKKIFYVIVVMFLMASAQTLFSQAIYEDSAGNKNKNTSAGTYFTANVANKTIKIETVQWIKLKEDLLLMGFGVSGKANNSIASILNSGSISPGTQLSVNIGYGLEAKKLFQVQEKGKLYKNSWNELDKLESEVKYLTTVPSEIDAAIQKITSELDGYKNDNKIDELSTAIKTIKGSDYSPDKATTLIGKIKQLKNKIRNDYSQIKEEAGGEGAKPDGKLFNLNVYYETAKFKMFSPELAFGEQISEEKIDGGGITLSYTESSKDNRFLFSTGAYVNWGNNASSLTKVKLTDTTTIGSSDNVVRTTANDIVALKGALESTTAYGFYGSAYYRFFPDLGGTVYGRLNVKGTVRLGLGAFVLNEKKDYAPVAGIAIEYNDNINGSAPEISPGNRWKVNLLLNLPFKINLFKFPKIG